ncbi:response regulator transcription factor [Marinobacterium sp. BA1]|uniref:response regulator transcription factor n=1 Tax=Marinobacterium sp. BA1 TaxID=3138931 RepID=UPI0032E69149
MSYTVYVVDDDESVSKSLQWLLEPLGYTVIVFHNGLEVINHFEKIGVVDIGCMILDLRMPLMSGCELQDELNDRGIDLPIIFLSGHGDIPQAISVIKSGADDFLQKPVNDQILLDKINRSIRSRIDRLDRVQSQQKASTIHLLTDRETEILRFVAEGLSSKEIARSLEISYKTVEVHRTNIRKKLNTKSVAELTKIYFDSLKND